MRYALLTEAFMPIKILFVDDERDLRMLINQRFRKQIAEGVYEFQFAGDGVEALELLRQCRGKTTEPEAAGEDPIYAIHSPCLPEIVLTDINMPRLDGLALSESVRELYPAIVVVVISAYDDIGNIRKAMNHNVSDFIVKPIDFVELELTIEKSHNRHLEIMEYNRRLLESAAKLRRTLGQTLEVISLIGEIRDPYTAGHQRRVAALARAIAKKMGAGPDRVEATFVAATLHDIGKIYVPAEILSKPGRLSTIEYSLIKEHSRLGFEILKPIEFPWPVADIVYQHHEHLDGTGYPNGMKGDEIMFEARILTVADLVEAVSSHRPYRVAMGNPIALDQIREGSGTIYDPEIVGACVSLFESGEFQFPE